MLRIIFCIYCGLLLGACRPEVHPEVYVRIVGAEKNVPAILTIDGREYPLILDSMGVAVLALPSLSGFSEGELKYGIYRLPLLVESGKGFEIYMSLLPDDFGAEFTGAGSVKNEIWNCKYFRPMADSVYMLDEEAFLRYIGESREVDRHISDSLGKNALFTALIEKKLELSALERLVSYPERHSRLTGQQDFLPSESYCYYVEERLKEHEVSLKQVAYRRILTEWIDMYISRKISGSDSFREFLSKAGYADTSFLQGGEQS